MKILIISPSLTYGSGWGNYSNSVIKNLKLREGIEVVVKSDSRELIPLISPLSFLRNLLRIRSAAKSVDVVHAFDGWPYSVYGYAGVFGTKKKLFITGIGTYSVAPFRSLVKGFLLNLAYKQARAIFCISNYTKQKIIEKTGLESAVTIYMGNQPKKTMSQGVVDAYKHKYGLSERYPIILTVGAIKLRKGQLDVSKAISCLRHKYPSIVYLMVGQTRDKSYIREIKSLATEESMADNIRILDDVNTEEALQAFYQFSDVFILASNNDNGHFEGFGLVLVEAASAGKPVIGSRNCGIEDALENGYNGYLVEQGSPRDIQEKLEKILSAGVENFKGRSQEFASRFSWDKTVDEYLKYYKK